MNAYVAFLRGINVGGRTIKMDALRELLEDLGYANVRTVLASGNVVFETKNTNPAKLKNEIEKGIKEQFGFDVHIILRSAKELKTLVKQDPFKGVKVTPQTRLYITFLSQPAKSKLKVPHKSLAGDYEILAVTPGHIASVLTLGKSGTVDAMAILSKEFGEQITTRNWNTIEKTHKLLA